jgi:alcohol dehydrogenase class IV
VEGMLSVRATDISNYIAKESIRKISQCLKFLSSDQELEGAILSADIREKLLYGSMLAGIVISHTGTTAVHSMGYSLTFFKNIDHGRANALLLPSFLRLVAKNDLMLINKILKPMGMYSIDEFEAEFFRLLGEREAITISDVEKFTAISSKAKNVNNSKVIPTTEDIYHVFTRSLQIAEL